MGFDNKNINKDKNEQIKDYAINNAQNKENSKKDLTSNETEKDNAFILSVKAFSHNDVRCSFPKKKKKIFTFSRVTTFFAFTFFIGVFVYSLYNIAINTIEYKRIEDFYASLKVPSVAQSAILKPNSVKQGNASNNLLSLVGGEKDIIDFDVAEPPEYYEGIYNQLVELTGKNEDVYGWIRINGTVVDYPILLGTDNKYYMSHTYEGDSLRAGSIMADCRTKQSLIDNYNLVIYGHCMTNGSMFRCIKDFYDNTSTRKAVAKNLEVEIITLDGVYIYDFFASYRTEDHSYIKMSFASKDAYTEYLASRLELTPNDIRFDTSYDKNSRIISLVTCTNVASEPDGRYVLTGILTEFINF